MSDNGLPQTVAFAGGNGENEIETYTEFLAKVRYSLYKLRNEEGVESPKSCDISMSDWIMQSVDFSCEPKERWDSYRFEGTKFLGCRFPPGVSASSVRARGAEVFENPSNLPFTPARGFMYRQEELQPIDDEIYRYYLREVGLGSIVFQSLHDTSIADALGDYCEGKCVVGIMGGHSLWRHSMEYQRVVRLCKALAELGVVVCTGGGPGAMEAANLGAYLYKRSEADVERALEIIGQDRDESGANYKKEAPLQVLKEFGYPTFQPSVGIPTWFYGHEPSNMFATWIGKYFSNAMRESHLLDICTGGVIFTRGAAGTRQEIFQFACTNHYAKPGREAPMVFLGEEFWAEFGVYKLVQDTARGRAYSEHLLCTDSIEKVVTHISTYVKKAGLPLIKSEEELREPFWISPELRDWCEEDVDIDVCHESDKVPPPVQRLVRRRTFGQHFN
eukprot:CAMPEP_0119142372 /NCGR_PEP_ID=MMETSP1310-20130426/32508_1 /TAXON_ID=464262 /ORGANISM="Genus nov. species nov., Strain RCC2339" /LENGTH=445 /DNA_ID=CAMNT_0007133905 /DNA_START=59 /DNA_END=1393 /DNA_ORIENTATION=-